MTISALIRSLAAPIKRVRKSKEKWNNQFNSVYLPWIKLGSSQTTPVAEYLTYPKQD